jgi:predicted nucleic acid-binding protein
MSSSNVHETSSPEWSASSGSTNHHHHGKDVGTTRLVLAIIFNALITAAEFVAGFVAGSLALMADAAHNLSDTASMGTSLVARKIATRAADEAHFAFAREEGRTIVTQDDDFLRLAAQADDHAGVVYLPQRRSIGETVRGLALIARVLGAEDMRGHVEFL